MPNPDLEIRGGGTSHSHPYIRGMGGSGLQNKNFLALQHIKAQKMVLSGRYGDPYGRPGDWCRIRESWHVWGWVGVVSKIKIFLALQASVLSKNKGVAWDPLPWIQHCTSTTAAQQTCPPDLFFLSFSYLHFCSLVRSSPYFRAPAFSHNL